MNAIAVPEPLTSLPALINRAAAQLASATTAAEVLDARNAATFAYETAQATARLAKMKQAHDDVLTAVWRAQADALDIESQAKRRLADEYDAAQQRGEVATDGRPKTVPDGNGIPVVTDLGLTRKEIHEARKIRDAEQADPGIVRRTVDAAVERGEAPTKAEVRRATGTGVDKSRAAVTAREARLRELAEAGATTQQIVADLGLSYEAVRATAKRIGVVVVADQFTRRTRRHDANRIASQIVMDIDHALADVALIDFSALDAESAREWVASLAASRRALSDFLRRLTAIGGDR